MQTNVNSNFHQYIESFYIYNYTNNERISIHSTWVNLFGVFLKKRVVIIFRIQLQIIQVVKKGFRVIFTPLFVVHTIRQIMKINIKEGGII